MRIRKILNNNAVISKDTNGNEVIVMGKGLAYGGHQGQEIPESKIIKTFVIREPGVKRQFVDMLQDIPISIILLTKEIVDMAKVDLKQKFSQTIYLALSDHINAAIKRYTSGLVLQNRLLFEIQRFYSEEYAVGKKAVAMIYDSTGIQRTDDEAGFIAIQIIGAETDQDIDKFYKSTAFINQILSIVKYTLNVDLDENSLAYNRFVTHLKYFAMNILSHQTPGRRLPGSDLLTVLATRYHDAFACAEKVSRYISQKYNYPLDDDEKLYLTIHIEQVIRLGVK
ncbi:BglG family transcription antiterminator LicT [Schleiferilactobacillus perolens]|uniref:Transcription antiterminator n=1 Tax=Schleiferilactobacillus perolens DSM 12744 TaxID=1423792 RepID=A0A0R1N9W4_9LACO|nr:PRD domain-containing protein [Schleiferilactobacillus perolens]KRL14498.1 transcription antiterminator [Schleiferilactobacillus perolens DSM 12744]